MQATRATDKKRQSQIRTLKVKSPVLLPHGFVLVSKKQYERLLEDLHDPGLRPPGPRQQSHRQDQ